MKSAILYVSLLLFANWCTGQNMGKIRVDPSKSYGGNVSDFFDSVEFIPLETTKASLFGSASFILVTDSSIVINDRDTRQILFFNTTGQFITKHHIKSNHSARIYNDNYKKTIVLEACPEEGAEDCEILEFTKQGNLIRTSKKVSNQSISIQLDSGFSAHIYAHRIPITDRLIDTTVSLASIYDRNHNLVRTSIPEKPCDNPFLFSMHGGATLSHPTNGEILLVLPFDYRIFRINHKSIDLLGQFVFPATSTVPEAILRSKNYKRLDSMRRILSRDFTKIHTVKNIVFHNTKILFTLSKITLMPDQSGIIYDPINFMYDTANQRLISFERIQPDSLSGFLPIMDGFSSISGMNYDDGYIYSTVSSFQMFESKKKLENSDAGLPPVMRTYFEKSDRRSNPVVVKMKLKE